MAPRQFRISLVNLISIFGLVYLLAVLSGIIPTDRLGNIEVVMFGLILLFNAELMSRLGKLQFGKDGVTLELAEIKDEQTKLRKMGEDNEAEIRQMVYFLARNFFDQYELSHLKRLTDAPPFRCKQGPAFDNELRRLRDLDMVTSTTDEQLRVSELPEYIDDLKKYVQITDHGQETLAMIERVMNIEVV
jgi:hypothetical protein